jgi:predicted lipid-binding transport protein (Tim44 family)
LFTAMPEEQQPTTIEDIGMTQHQTSTQRPRRLRGLIVLATVLAMVAGSADARVGRGSSGGLGSRGSRTYEAPPPTNTAPGMAAPVERSMTQPGRTNPGMQQPAAPSRGFFGGRGGFFGGLAGGLLGAGLFGLLFGHGLFGGMGGFASILGLLLQIVLIVFLVRFAIRFFARRSRPAYAGAGAPLNRDAMASGHGPGTPGGATASSARPRNAAVRDEIGIQQADYGAFEQLLNAIQTAYGQEDRNTLRSHTTPEMASYLEQELAENSARGVVNRVSDVRLLQGDLAEAWREGSNEYATVAMRFSLIDTTVDQATGKIVEGDPNRPTEATELWTFIRPRGGQWVLSAIQKS